MRLAFSIAVALALTASLVSLSEASAEVRGPVSGPAVLVELFTSQGCSSCPPADALLRELASDEDLASHIVPLSFHVDYWNRLGWSDPFSSREWSERQRLYAAERGFRVYTPQMVIDGREDAVGSGAVMVRQALKRALGERPPVDLRLKTQSGVDDLAVIVSIEVKGQVEAKRLALMVALYESGLATDIGRGENAGRILRNDFVVRRMKRIAWIKNKVSTQRFETSFAIDPAWNKSEVGVAAFLQDPETGRVYGAVSTGP